ncbi:nwd2 [Moniliophthora roreri MCA 2997]|uniref:Nwd2 n=2 Tax=Moniliophthora roreri TaxID=221103 RepID=V2X4T6_MONRO|nr:nwd2 [Moniliophthora roreri MCA 2997]KAI3619206.1 nwd2 [Moniliophthora roreri]
MSMFQGAHGVHVSGGQLIAIGRDVNHNYLTDPLHDLWQAIKDVGASHNSEIRYPPPRCHPETRQDVIRVLHEWIHCPFPGQPMMWLYGPPGAGKSAIAQTVSETGQKEGYLASSFFFSRGDPKRGVANSLCLCIAYGLATRIPELRKPITEAIKDPTILQATLEEQLQKLIVEPCRTLEKSRNHPWLIIIDGLDECKGSREQQRILSLLATIFPEHIHLRFLICSRPEPHIREAFDFDSFQPYLRRVALDKTLDTRRDIATFLDSECNRIRADPRNRHIPFPNPWPVPGVVYVLAQKACGQFIYATTVIKFVDNEYSNPCTQLVHVLHPPIHPNPELGSPWHDLDVLYRQILSSNPQRSKVRDVIWAIALLPPQHGMGTEPEYIEAFLLLPKGDVISTLRGMHSILEIGGPRDIIRTFHASFHDFLLDKSRSGYFFMGNKQKQYSFLACRTLRILEHYSRIFNVAADYSKHHESVQWRVFYKAWNSWGDDCSRSDLNDEVLNALQKFDFGVVFGTQFRRFLLASEAKQRLESRKSIEQFFFQTQLLLERLHMDPASYNDIIRCFSDYRRGFTVKVSHPGVPGMAASRILDVAAQALGYSLIYSIGSNEALLQLRELGKIPRVRDLFKYHLQIVPTGSGCQCTRASSCLSLPCLELTSRGIYHIQLSVAVRNPAANVLSNPIYWYTETRTKRLACHIPNVRLHRLCDVLDICGPTPEFLDALPRVVRHIKSLKDKADVSRWLQSFPAEYADRTLPLIAKAEEIVCRTL